MFLDIDILNMSNNGIGKKGAANQRIMITGHCNRLLRIYIEVEIALFDAKNRSGIYYRQPSEIIGKIYL